MQYGNKYTLTGPYGDVATFNDMTDPLYVGMLTDVTGLDSPDIRENAADLVGTDGGIHGDFFLSRRPVVLNGIVIGHTSVAERNVRLIKLKQVAAALRKDTVLRWTWDGLPEMYLSCRLNQPLRITDAWNKTFQLPLVAADPRIYSFALNSASVAAVAATDLTGRSYDSTYDKDFGPAVPNGQLLVTNAGTITTYPVFTITGPGVNPLVYNQTNGGQLALNYTLADGETMVIDTLNHTVKLGGTVDRYYALDFDRTTWFGLEPGLNDVRIAFNTFSSGASLNVAWRDAWL